MGLFSSDPAPAKADDGHSLLQEVEDFAASMRDRIVQRHSAVRSRMSALEAEEQALDVAHQKLPAKTA